MADVRFVGTLEFSRVWGVVINSSAKIVYPAVWHYLIHAGNVTKWFVASLVAVYFWISRITISRLVQDATVIDGSSLNLYIKKTNPRVGFI